MLGSIGKQSGESVESVQEKKRKAMVRRICKQRRFCPLPCPSPATVCWRSSSMHEVIGALDTCPTRRQFHTADHAAVTCGFFQWLSAGFLRPGSVTGWIGSRVVSVLDSGSEGPGFKSQPRRCRVRVTVLGKLFTPIVPLFTKQRNW